MKNILSYCNGYIFSGKEIMDWSYAFSQSKNKKGKYARYILKHYRLIPNRRYNVYTHTRPEPVVMKLDIYLNRKGELCTNYLLTSYSF